MVTVKEWWILRESCMVAVMQKSKNQPTSLPIFVFVQEAKIQEPTNQSTLLCFFSLREAKIQEPTNQSAFLCFLSGKQKSKN